MKTPVLETKRLILRPICNEDAAGIQKYFDDWDVIKMIGGGVPWPYPKDGAQKFLDAFLPKMEKGESFGWAIVTKDNPEELIGQAAYRHITDQDDHRSFWLGKPFWGKGYMTEAIAAVQDFIFIDLEVPSIIVRNSHSNGASRRIKEKLGGRLIRTELTPDEYYDGASTQEVWEVTREEWLKIRNCTHTPSETPEPKT